MEGSDSDIVRGYNNLMYVPLILILSRTRAGSLIHSFRPLVFGTPSARGLVRFDTMRIFPNPMIEWLQDRQSNPALEKARECERLTLKFAKELVDTKASALKQGKGNKDVFSLLGESNSMFLICTYSLVPELAVKANATEDARSRLSDEEMYARMRCVLLLHPTSIANRAH